MARARERANVHQPVVTHGDVIVVRSWDGVSRPAGGGAVSDEGARALETLREGPSDRGGAPDREATGSETVPAASADGAGEGGAPAGEAVSGGDPQSTPDADPPVPQYEFGTWRLVRYG